MDQVDCYHCGQPVPVDLSLTVTIGEDTHPVCCLGCRAVANLLVNASLSAFYTHRTAFSPTPDSANTHVADWFKDRDWLSTFAKQDSEGLHIPLLVSGMSCAACSWVIEQFLNKRADVTAVDINLSLSRVVISMLPDSDPAGAASDLASLGYIIRPWRADERLDQLRRDSKRDLRRLGVAGVGMMQVGMSAIGLHAGELQGIDASIQQLLRAFSAPLTLLVVLYSGRSFFTTAWQHLKQGALVMDSSVALALTVATTASLWATFSGGGDTYYDSVVMFVFFLLLARYTEKRLRDADLMALVHIEDSLPEFVNLRKEQGWCRVPRHQIVEGDIVRVSAGEAIAFDCDVIEGETAVEESVFNGESLPRAIKPGDRVYAGTVNCESTIDLQVGANYRDSRLAALASDVERARQEKPVFLQLIDKLASRFVAGVFLAALGTAIFWSWVEPANALWTTLAVLVVACPCALSLATPAALAGASARLRQVGITVHGEFGLLAAADASDMLIDKTGTLTRAQLVINTIQANGVIAPKTVLEIAAALQQFSSHPAARTFHGYPSQIHVDQLNDVPGAGIEGYWQDESQSGNSRKQVRIGSLQFCRELCPALPNPPDREHYWIGLVSNQDWLAWIGLSEELREEAPKTIAKLKSQGLTIAVLSGDTHARVKAIAQQLSLSYQAGCQPRDKLHALKTLQSQGHIVIAVGDGLNDAPFLGAADASIAVTDATALAKAQADFVVTEGSLTSIPRIIEVAHKARQVIRQNLMWAGSYNLIGIPFAAMGYVPPWLAALGMSVSSLIVVLNALRLRRVTLSHE